MANCVDAHYYEQSLHLYVPYGDCFWVHLHLSIEFHPFNCVYAWLSFIDIENCCSLGPDTHWDMFTQSRF